MKSTTIYTIIFLIIGLLAPIGLITVCAFWGDAIYQFADAVGPWVVGAIVLYTWADEVG
jgi:fumarate reductase subunit D